MTASEVDELIRPGSLAMVLGDFETWLGDHYRTPPPFIMLNQPSSEDDVFLADQVHVPVTSVVLIVSLRRVKGDDWSVVVLFDGRLLASFYSYTRSTMQEVFEVISDVDKCVG